ncbi:MAG: class I SAM-dependent methyltransferase [Polyangiaceae bacterium]
MTRTLDHYESLLAEHYSWIYGDFDARRKSATEGLRARGVSPHGSGFALDLGAGAGCHSLALIDLGFRVRAVDFSRKLLTELLERAQGASVEIVEADLLDTQAWGEEAPELIVCMGDTLTHLNSPSEIQALFRAAYQRIALGGRLVITYRDLGVPLAGPARFIPVRADEDRIFTCFLEYGPEHVEVHDLVYVRGDSGWRLATTSYPKLRLAQDRALAWLAQAGFAIEHVEVARGMTEIVARK